MSFSTTLVYKEHMGNDVTTIWPFPYAVLEESQINVYVKQPGDEEYTKLTSNFSVVLSSGGGAEVTYPLSGSPLATGGSIKLIRNTTSTQPTVLENQTRYFPGVIETALDRIMQRVQELEFNLAQTIHVGPAEAILNALPSVAARSGMVLSFLSNGQPTVIAPTVADVTVENGLRTPWDYNAPVGEEETSDNTAYVQAMIDACCASWNAATNSFGILPSFGGKLWRCDGEIFLNHLRQPGFVVFGFGGGIHSHNTNGVALNAMNTNQITFVDVHLHGDEVDTPDIGIAYGRVTGGAIAPGVRLHGFFTRGNFNKAAGFNLASEVGGHFGCYFQNSSPDRTAVAFAWAGILSGVDAKLTGGSASIQASFDVGGNSVANTANASNLGHTLLSCDYKRGAPKTLTILSITQANPAVVTVAAGTLATSGWVNGTEITVQENGMVELKGHVFTIANINTGADTFELSGINSTAYTASAGGSARQATGPAFYIQGVSQMNMMNAYPLAYCEVGHIIDMSVGSSPRDINLHFQGESANTYCAEIILPSSGTAIVQGGFRWYNMNSSQVIGEAVFKVTGAGSLRLDGCDIYLSNLPTPYPTGGLFDNPANISLYGKVTVAVEEILTPANEYALYKVLETAYNRSERFHDYRDTVFYGKPTFRVEGGNLVALVVESVDTAASASDNNPPYMDLYRNNETVIDNDGLGRVRFTANNDAVVSTLDVISISKANPAVVSVNAAALLAAGWANGYRIAFGELVGMQELKGRSFTVANINVGAGTFELSGEDSSLYEDFVSATVSNTNQAQYAGVAAYLEDKTAYAEYGRLLLQAIINGQLTTVGYANEDGLYIGSELATTGNGVTGGAGSAGAGNQHVRITVNGVTYKVLHDGTV